jgi:hypothetical protein
MRFSIRDLLWLIALSAMVAVVWSERRSLRIERDNLRKERTSLSAETMKLDKHHALIQNVVQKLARNWKSLDPQLQSDLGTVLNETRKTTPISDAEMERFRQQGAAVGAPQPVPLPD